MAEEEEAWGRQRREQLAMETNGEREEMEEKMTWRERDSEGWSLDKELGASLGFGLELVI